MKKKIIDRLYGLPYALIILILLVKYLDLFFIPNWVVGSVLVWGAIGFFVESMRQRVKKL
jgi:MFS superfamily sulfate permease-like transporter